MTSNVLLSGSRIESFAGNKSRNSVSILKDHRGLITLTYTNASEEEGIWFPDGGPLTRKVTITPEGVVTFHHFRDRKVGDETYRESAQGTMVDQQVLHSEISALYEALLQRDRNHDLRSVLEDKSVESTIYLINRIVGEGIKSDSTLSQTLYGDREIDQTYATGSVHACFQKKPDGALELTLQSTRKADKTKHATRVISVQPDGKLTFKERSITDGAVTEQEKEGSSADFYQNMLSLHTELSKPRNGLRAPKIRSDDMFRLEELVTKLLFKNKDLWRQGPEELKR